MQDTDGDSNGVRRLHVRSGIERGDGLLHLLLHPPNQHCIPFTAQQCNNNLTVPV